MTRTHQETRRGTPVLPLTGALLLLLTGLSTGLVPGAQAAPALPATCQGVPATLVSKKFEVVGTEGRDVIVAGAGSDVHALGGDDLICLVDAPGNSNVFSVWAGEGDDVVDTTAVLANFYVTVDLGAGSDRFVGGPADESVTTDGPTSAEDDHVATGSGNDYVTTGTPGLPNGDTVQLGAGDDSVSPRGSVLTGPPLDAGPDGGALVLDDPAGAYAIDNVAGSASRDGQPWARWTGIDEFWVWESPAGFSFTGSDRDESITFNRAYAGVPRSIDLGGGDDDLSIFSVTRAGEDYRGGSGRDYLMLGSVGPALGLDLASGAFHLDRALAGEAEGSATGFEGAHVLAPKASLRGTRRADVLTLTGCRMEAHGGPGADRITRIADYTWEAHPSGCSGTNRAVFRGGRGNDSIRGGLGDDRLYGGPGRDKIDGWSGTDLCRGETVYKCER